MIKERGRGLPRVRVDRPRLEQVFINLFMNAAEAQPGGGRIWVRTYREDAPGRNGVAIITEVENEGKGIPEEHLARVFDPFFTTKRNIGGTGLGLSIVKNILDMHNAKIQIGNRENGGVRVALQFET